MSVHPSSLPGASPGISRFVLAFDERRVDQPGGLDLRLRQARRLFAALAASTAGSNLHAAGFSIEPSFTPSRPSHAWTTAVCSTCAFAGSEPRLVVLQRLRDPDACAVRPTSRDRARPATMPSKSSGNAALPSSPAARRRSSRSSRRTSARCRSSASMIAFAVTVISCIGAIREVDHFLRVPHAEARAAADVAGVGRAVA